MLKQIKSILCITTLAFAPLSFATLFEYNSGAGNARQGSSFDNLFASYDDSSNVLTWKAENFTNRDGDVADGMWLVLNNGPGNPKGDDGLAIFYADFHDSDGAEHIDNVGLWAYGYNGLNDSSSYLFEDSLGSFEDSLIISGTTRGFSLDVSSIYENLSSDQPFDENIGIWFHPTWGTESFASNDILASFNFEQQAWYDRSGRQTVVSVSEPTTFVLLLIGALGLVVMRRRSL